MNIAIKHQPGESYPTVRIPSRWNGLVEAINNFNKLAQTNPSLAKELVSTINCSHDEVEFNDHNIPFCMDCGDNLLGEREEVMADREMQRQKEEG